MLRLLLRPHYELLRQRELGQCFEYLRRGGKPRGHVAGTSKSWANRKREARSCGDKLETATTTKGTVSKGRGESLCSLSFIACTLINEGAIRKEPEWTEDPPARLIGIPSQSVLLIATSNTIGCSLPYEQLMCNVIKERRPPSPHMA